jgi:RimJ/RimL family protein N-acetyltransferase
MKPMRTERLILRNWREADRDLFEFINSDDRVMEFFPMRRSRTESDELMDILSAEIETNGFGFAAIEIAATGETAGFAGLHLCKDIPGIEPGEVEIGWRLAPQFWGMGIVTEAARRWLGFGFDDLGRERIISFAVEGNDRSTAVMRGIGMHAVPEMDFDHPAIPETHLQLKRHVFYEMMADDWRARLN